MCVCEPLYDRTIVGAASADRVISKVVWSLVLLIPLFGWLLFAAFYRSPDALSWTEQAEHARDADVASKGSDHV